MVREFKARKTLRRWLPGGILVAVILAVLLWWPQGGLTDYEKVGLAFYKDIWLNQDSEAAQKWLSQDTRITEKGLMVDIAIAENRSEPKTIWLLENEETKERDDEKHLLIHSPETKRSHLLVLIREEGDWKIKNGEITRLTNEEIDRYEPGLEWKEVSL
jgi:hypothetical protein